MDNKLEIKIRGKIQSPGWIRKRISKIITGKYVPCDYCKKSTWKVPYQLKIYKNMFCSYKCKSKFIVGKRLTMEHRIKIGKSQRGKVISLKTRKLLSKVLSGSGNGMFGKAHSLKSKAKISLRHKGKRHKCWKNFKGGMVDVVCPECNKIRIYSSGMKLKTNYCIKCYGIKCFSGVNNTFWKGGKSFEPYSAQWTDKLKWKIRERDNYLCQLCKQMTNEEHLIIYDVSLDVHHKDYDKKNCSENNLISLCRQCHSRTNYNREYWREYFEEKSVTLT